jgi:hypothetical protein
MNLYEDAKASTFQMANVAIETIPKMKHTTSGRCGAH